MNEWIQLFFNKLSHKLQKKLDFSFIEFLLILYFIVMLMLSNFILY